MADGNVNSSGGWGRRDFLGGAALLAMALGIPAAAVKLSSLDADSAPSQRQSALMKEVAQLVIPATGTKGAGDVGVGAFVLLALAHGLENARAPLAEDAPAALMPFRRRDGSLDHAAWLEAELDRRAGADFLKAAPDTRTAALTTLDAEAFAEGQNAHPWRTVKALILLGYYTSEEGGSRELAYEHVPANGCPIFRPRPMRDPSAAIGQGWSSDNDANLRIRRNRRGQRHHRRLGSQGIDRSRPQSPDD